VYKSALFLDLGLQIRFFLYQIELFRRYGRLCFEIHERIQYSRQAKPLSKKNGEKRWISKQKIR